MAGRQTERQTRRAKKTLAALTPKNNQQLPVSVWRLLERVYTLMMREARKRVEATKPQRDVLAQLALPPNGLTFVALSSALQASATNLTRLVDRLVHSGLVVREPNPRDRRSLIIRLSPQGQAYVKEEALRHSRDIGEIFRGVAQRDLKIVLGVFSKAEAAVLARASTRHLTQNVKSEA